MRRRNWQSVLAFLAVFSFCSLLSSQVDAKGSHGGGGHGGGGHVSTAAHFSSGAHFSSAAHVSNGAHFSAGVHSAAHFNAPHFNVQHVNVPHFSANHAGVHSANHAVVNNHVHTVVPGVSQSFNGNRINNFAHNPNWNDHNWNGRNWNGKNWNGGDWHTRYPWGFPYWSGIYLGGLGGYAGFYPDYGYDNGSYVYSEPSYQTVVPNDELAADSMTYEGGYLDQARAAFRAGNYQEALRLAGHASVDAPQDPQPHELASLALLGLNDYHGASVEAHAVAALGTPSNWQQLASNYPDVQTYTDQLRALEKYVGENEASADGHFVLGMQYLTTGYKSAAANQFAKVTELTPNDQIAQRLLKQLEA